MGEQRRNPSRRPDLIVLDCQLPEIDRNAKSAALEDAQTTTSPSRFDKRSAGVY
jgi:CheY-like chemotaxis protein